MNLAPLFDAAVAVAAAVVTACVPIVTFKVTQWLGVKMDTDQRNSLNAALDTSLGKALEVGQTAGDAKLANVTIKNTGVAAAVAYVTANAPDAIAHFGLTDAGIAEKAAARLATLLHVTNSAPASSPTEAAATGAMLEKVHAPDPVMPAVAQAPAPEPAKVASTTTILPQA